jgi:4-hydroxybenzoate polyprenyltransferase
MINKSNNSATDIPQKSWINDCAHKNIQPYLRLVRADRPIGIWLLVLPCWWSVSLASPAWPDIRLLTLFTIGALIMRGAGCTINDIIDRELDVCVARTSTRPVASGEISVFKALIFLGLLLGFGLIVLLQFNTFTIVLGASSLILVTLYPFMKRLTYWPQLFLGFTFNWGALVGWTAVTGTMASPAIILYLAGVFWTLGYDTIYAHQDKKDDILIGVKSTALKLGDATKKWLFGFYTTTIFLLLVVGILADLYWPFYLCLFLGSLHLLSQIKSIDITDPKNCLSRFKSNRNFGLIILVGIITAQTSN